MSTSVTVQFASGTFTGEQIKSAHIIENLHPLSVELLSDTLQLNLVSSGTFSVFDPTGFLATLQYKQPLNVYANITGSEVFMGRFYLDTWESLSENEAVFYAFDAIGLLDTTTTLGNDMPNGIVLVDDLVNALMTEAGVSYSLDSSLTGSYLWGWIPRVTHREALQQICFAIGAYATCARSTLVQIKPMELVSGLDKIDYTIRKAQKGLGSSVSLLPLVTAVEVDAHFFSTEQEGGYKQVFSDSLDAGTHRIYFDVPMWNGAALITGSVGTTLVWFDTNYMDISVPSSGLVIIQASEFLETKKPFYVSGSFPANTPTNVIKIPDAKLVTNVTVGPGTDNAQSTVNRVYRYYQQRYEQKAKLFAHPVTVGDAALIFSQGNYWVLGVVERVEIDLTGGFISQIEVVGINANSDCDNILTEDTTVATGNDLTYQGCLDMLYFNLTLEGEANLVIN